MMRKIDLFVLLWSILLGISAAVSAKGRLTSQVYVCEDDVIDLMMTDEHPESAITGSLIFKNGGGDETIMTKERDEEAVIAPRWSTRTEYVNPLGIKINYATVNDSGPYEIHVVFVESEVWHRWNVSVFTGCPKKSDYFSLGITYRLDRGSMEPLPDTLTLQFAAPKLLTLKVSIPMSNLPVTCSMWGHGNTISTADGSRDKTVYCQATFDYNEPENGTLLVELSHKIRGPVKTEIQVSATAAGGPSTDVLEEEDSPSPLLWLLVLLLGFIIYIGLVGSIILCKHKEIGLFKKKLDTESDVVDDESQPNRSYEDEMTKETVQVPVVEVPLNVL